MFLRHVVPWPSVTFVYLTEIVPGEPLRWGGGKRKNQISHVFTPCEIMGGVAENAKPDDRVDPIRRTCNIHLTV